MNLNDLIEQRGETKYSLSKKCKIAYSSFTDMCSGKTSLLKTSSLNVLKIASALDMSVEELLAALYKDEVKDIITVKMDAELGKPKKMTGKQASSKDAAGKDVAGNDANKKPADKKLEGRQTATKKTETKASAKNSAKTKNVVKTTALTLEDFGAKVAFKSNVNRLIAIKGEASFIEMVKAGKIVDKLFDDDRYEDCCYLVDKIDALSSKNHIKKNPDYNFVREYKKEHR